MATQCLLGVNGLLVFLLLPLLPLPSLRAEEGGSRDWPKAVPPVQREEGQGSVVSPRPELDVEGEVNAKAAADHYRLALWCDQRGHTERMAEQARLVIVNDPDHAGARAMLGHAWTGARWLPSNPVELQEYVRDLQVRVNDGFQQLVSPDPKKRAQANTALLLIAKHERIPEVEAQATRLFAEADAFYRSLSRRAAVASRPRGVLELRLTNSKLKGIRDRTVGTGNGGPVTLQLPELQSTSIKTTTVVPLGGG